MLSKEVLIWPYLGTQDLYQKRVGVAVACSSGSRLQHIFYGLSEKMLPSGMCCGVCASSGFIFFLVHSFFLIFFFLFFFHSLVVLLIQDELCMMGPIIPPPSPLLYYTGFVVFAKQCRLFCLANNWLPDFL